MQVVVRGGVVHVTYDLIARDPSVRFTLRLEVSRDGGKTFDFVPQSVSGAVGTGVTAGAGKEIVWEAAKDVETLDVERLRYRIAVEEAARRTATPSFPPAPAVATGTLSVSSDPPGATVYVDDELRGQAPLTLAGLSVGDHRLRLVRDGYLENRRVVMVQADRTERVEVRLTAVQAAAEPPPATPSAQGGGMPKWVLPVVAVAGGAGVAVAVAGGGGGGGGGGTTTPTPPTPTPTPTPNRAPSISSATVDNSFGIAFLTTFTFNASASDPDGDSLTYTWDFRDGTLASGSSVRKAYSTGDTFNVSLTISDGRGGSATATVSVTVGSMTGQWRGSIACGTGGDITLSLTQDGSQIRGTFSFPRGCSNAPPGASGQIPSDEPGSIDASGNVRMRLKLVPFIDPRLRGQMDRTGRRVEGRVDESGFEGESFRIDKQ